MELNVFSVLSHSFVSDCDSMDCTPPGSSVCGISQARILEWVAIPFSRGSPWPSDRTQVSRIAGRFFTVWASREALKRHVHILETVSVTLFGKSIPANVIQLRIWRWDHQDYLGGPQFKAKHLYKRHRGRQPCEVGAVPACTSGMWTHQGLGPVHWTHQLGPV